MDICAPAIIYAVFSLCQIIIDLFTGLYNTALVKLFVAILITILLNGLCQLGLGVVSWVIVFVPFILMTFIVAMLLYIFGLKATTGTLNVLDASSNPISNNSQQPQQITPITGYPSGSTSPEYQSISFY
jgi:hypothetical protein